MPFTHSDLEAMAADKPITDRSPWTEADRRITKFYQGLAQAAARRLKLEFRAEWNHYGSGYASFVDLWFYRDNEEFRLPTERGQSYRGVFVLLGRLGPHFALGEGQKGWDAQTAGSYLPGLEMVDRFSTRATEQLARQLSDFLGAEYGLARLQAEELTPILDPQCDIPTNLSDPPYSVFDAVFHWMD